MSAVVAGLPLAEVEYPEGEKVPEGDLHARRCAELVFALRHWLEGRPGGEAAWVCDDINVYYVEGDPREVAAPDVAVAFGVNVDALAGAGSYLVWEAGAAPGWVLEVASPATVDVDAVAKPAVYAAMGVVEYWRLDPHGGELFDPPLWGARRVGDGWEPIPVGAGAGGVLRGHSAVLGLDLCWEPPKLRLFDTVTGEWLLDPDDRVGAQQAAEARAEDHLVARRAAEARADAAVARAEDLLEARRAAEARAAAVEAELEELRRHLGRTDERRTDE